MHMFFSGTILSNPNYTSRNTERKRLFNILSARSIRALIGLAFFSKKKKKKCGHFAQVHRIKTQNIVLSVIIGE